MVGGLPDNDTITDFVSGTDDIDFRNLIYNVGPIEVTWQPTDSGDAIIYVNVVDPNFSDFTITLQNTTVVDPATDFILG